MLAQRNITSPVLQSTAVDQVDNAHFLYTSSPNAEQQQGKKLPTSTTTQTHTQSYKNMKQNFIPRNTTFSQQEPWGDVMHDNQDNTFRVYFQNICG